MNQDTIYALFEHADPGVFLCLRILCKETLKQSESYLTQQYDMRLCNLLKAMRISAPERRLNSWRLRMHFESSERPFPLYTCSKCGREISDLGSCVACKRPIPDFPWPKALSGPAIVSLIILGITVVDRRT